MLRIFIIVILFILQNVYAVSLDDGDKLLKQNKIIEAISLFKGLARDGNNDAYFKLGVIHFNGKYVNRDLEKAINYFKIPASYGNAKAKYNMAIIYSQKSYNKLNHKKAYKLFLELAKENHKGSQYMVGNSLLRGIGTKIDYKEALKWFEYSYFENGYIPSSCMISIMYVNGFGVLQNFGRASKMAKFGIKHNLKLCKKVYNEFNLHKYPSDNSFKFGYYRNL